MTTRKDRLLGLVTLLGDGGVHRAEDLAHRFGVSVRTIYRDLDRLSAAGVPVTGTRGQGYRARSDVTLPPLDLGLDELEALHLGLAIVGEAGEGDLRQAAARLWARIDALLPDEAGSPAALWGDVLALPGSAARVLRHLPAIRAAVRARQKLALTLESGESLRLRPLELSYWGRIWTLTGWSEGEADFRILDPSAIRALQVLPELFVDEAGRTLADFRARGRAPQ